MTQTVIFVNTKSFADTLFKILKKNGIKPAIIFGDMSPEERDEMVEKFRRQEIKVVITTNLLARGLDVPEI
jgi:superfamily II DNA/RNA helicase